MAPENTIYYVAIDYKNLAPLIVENFDNEPDANCYAALMSRTKKKSYVVLKQTVAFDGTAVE